VHNQNITDSIKETHFYQQL